jgi:prepilin-type N-terminal cleavage/methylation domain-containing protein
MNRRRRHGFTLPEVLATLVIVGIELPVAMRGITLSMQAAGEARHKTEAGQLAQQKLSELLLDSSGSASFGGSGDFGTDFPEYKWESTSGTASLNTTAQVEEVDVTVKWTAQGTERSVKLSTLVFPQTSTTEAQ